MVLIGLGLYMPYVAVHTTVLERFIALSRERGNLGFLMSLVDSIGYFGYVVVLLVRKLIKLEGNILQFFTGADTAPVTNIFDLNRDGRVNAQDTSIVRNNQQTGGIVAPINAPPAKSPARSRFGTSSSQSNSLPVGLADLKDNDDTTEKDNSGLKIVDDFFATL